MLHKALSGVICTDNENFKLSNRLVRTLVTFTRKAFNKGWLALPGNTRGAIWIMLSTVIFTMMATTIKTMGQYFDSMQIVFFRCLFHLLSLLPFIIREGGWSVIRTDRFPLHLLRVSLGLVAMFCGFYAFVNLPLADAVSLSFARPLFIIPLAVLFLHEVVRVRRWSATAIGFIGVILILRPGEEAISIAALVALFGAMTVACVHVVIKRLTSTERPLTISAWFGIIATVVSLIPALFVWQQPSLEQLFWLGFMGACGAGAQYMVIRAYRVGEATAVSPFDYIRLVLAGAVGYFVFAEAPDAWTWAGSAVIIGSTLYIARREARRKKETSSGTSSPGTSSMGAREGIGDSAAARKIRPEEE